LIYIKIAVFVEIIIENREIWRFFPVTLFVVLMESNFSAVFKKRNFSPHFRGRGHFLRLSHGELTVPKTCLKMDYFSVSLALGLSDLFFGYSIG
jgi:hypothetical protein